MKLKKRYFGLIGIAILAFILYGLDLQKFFATLLKINPGLFLAGMFLGLVSIVFKGLKYKVVVKAHNNAISLANSTKYFLIGFFLSLITPGRIGEIARAIYANQEINNIGKSISTVVFDRIIDVALLIGIGFIAALYFSFALQAEVIPLEVIAVVAIAFCLLLFLLSKKNITVIFLKPFFNALVPERFKQKAKTGFESFYLAMGEAAKNKKQLAIATLIGLFTWVIVAFSLFLYLLSLSIVVPFDFVFLLFPAITLVEMIPVSFSGLGTREAMAIFLLGFYGISAAEAVAFSMLVFVIGYLLNSLIGFALFTRESAKVDLASLQ